MRVVALVMLLPVVFDYITALYQPRRREQGAGRNNA